MSGGKITVYGSDWCGDCIRVRRFLTQNQIEFQWVNVDRDKEGEKFVYSVNKGMRSVPTIVFEDGSFLVEPSNQKLAFKLGLQPA
jgi:glutaredoxin-like protein